MAILQPFRGIRPIKERAAQVVSRPYDVLNPQEAANEATGNPYSFYHVVKPEIDFAEKEQNHWKKVYEKGRKNFLRMLEEGLFFQDNQPCFYVYRLTMNGHAQTGIVGCAAVADYLKGSIKKHEQVQPHKVEDRKQHLAITRLHAEPVFYSYKADKAIDDIVTDNTSLPAEYAITTNDGIDHTFWVIKDEQTINTLVALFEKVDYIYIADGHHRTAAAAAYHLEHKNENSRSDVFPVVVFPHNQLRIMDYNRLVKDLNGHSISSFIDAVNMYFTVALIGRNTFKPSTAQEFGMYIAGNWYSLIAKPAIIQHKNTVDTLDVSILTEYLLKPILGIIDQQTDRRISFMGGMRGLKALQNKVDNGEMAVAFALHPASMEQFFAVADADLLMPPKSTWFEPKLRSGLIIHSIDQ